jgi:hypothetical protein
MKGEKKKVLTVRISQQALALIKEAKGAATITNYLVTATMEKAERDLARRCVLECAQKLSQLLGNKPELGSVSSVWSSLLGYFRVAELGWIDRAIVQVSVDLGELRNGSQEYHSEEGLATYLSDGSVFDRDAFQRFRGKISIAVVNAYGPSADLVLFISADSAATWRGFVTALRKLPGIRNTITIDILPFEEP